VNAGVERRTRLDEWRSNVVNMELIDLFTVLPGLCGSAFSASECAVRDDVKINYSSFVSDYIFGAG